MRKINYVKCNRMAENFAPDFRITWPGAVGGARDERGRVTLRRRRRIDEQERANHR